MIWLTQGEKSHKTLSYWCDPWLLDASALEDTRSSQIYKIISCILLYNDAKILIFYKIKRIDREKMSKTGQNAWFWSRKKAQKGFFEFLVSSFWFRVSSSFSVTTPKAAEPSAKAFGRSIVLCTFKNSFSRLRREIKQIAFKIQQKKMRWAVSIRCF